MVARELIYDPNVVGILETVLRINSPVLRRGEFWEYLFS